MTDSAHPPSLQAAVEELTASIDSPLALKLFTESHVFCVFDFMSLLKSLQAELTCVSTPWLPVADSESARLISEIVLGEESDIDEEGRVTSHFDWYLEAMTEIGADTRPIRRFVNGLRSGQPALELLRDSSIPRESATFTGHTLSTLQEPLHVRAASFFHGREDLIPALFLPLVRELEERGLRCGRLIGYLERHIEVDGEDHGPRAQALLDRVCRGDEGLRAEARKAADSALQHREDLWRAIASRIQNQCASSQLAP